MRWEPTHSTEKKRLEVLGGCFCLLILVFLFRAFSFQVWKREPWKSMASNQYQHRVKLIANRGLLYDRHMNILAMDMPVFSLAVDPKQIKDFSVFSQQLAQILNGKKETYFQLLNENTNRSYVFLKSEISEDQHNELLNLNHPGIIIVKDRKRVHPFGDLSFQILGVTNGERAGVGGVEQAFNQTLSGDDGWAILQKSGLDKSVFSCPEYPIRPSQNGKHLVLSIDHSYQTILEEELQKGVLQYGAKNGMILLMDPYTGEILGMASVVKEALQGRDVDFGRWIQNQTVQVDFEPGSTFKIVALAAAIEEEYFQTNTLIHCENGAYKVGQHTIHDHNEKYAWLTLSQVIENSSNIGISKVGKKLGKKVFYRYIQNFGFGNRTQIGLPGEVPGILRPVYQWGEFATASISFGQGLSVTALQLAGMVSTIANGGELMNPLLIRSVLDDNGEPLKTNRSQVLRRVISRETASQVSQILENVVKVGSGKKAKVEGLRIAGKTGTAQKSVPGFKGYLPNAYVSSFVGYWPVDTPLFVMVVVLDEPSFKYHWGSHSAAPLFSRIASRISGIPFRPSPEIEGAKKSNKQFVLSSLQPAERGEKVGNGILKPEFNSPYHIPKLIGLSVRAAMKKMSAYSLEVKVQGSGIVKKQSPKAGTKISEEIVCYLTCQEES